MAASKTPSGVGPGRPPKHSQFEKGQSGNPAGRPPKQRDLRKLVDAELDETVSLTEGGKRVKLTKRQILAKTLVNEAAKGNLKALETVLKLVGNSSESENRFMDIPPAMLASYVARHSGSEGKK